MNDPRFRSLPMGKCCIVTGMHARIRMVERPYIEGSLDDKFIHPLINQRDRALSVLGVADISLQRNNYDNGYYPDRCLDYVDPTLLRPGVDLDIMIPGSMYEPVLPVARLLMLLEPFNQELDRFYVDILGLCVNGEHIKLAEYAYELNNLDAYELEQYQFSKIIAWQQQGYDDYYHRNALNLVSSLIDKARKDEPLILHSQYAVDWLHIRDKLPQCVRIERDGYPPHSKHNKDLIERVILDRPAF